MESKQALSTRNGAVGRLRRLRLMRKTTYWRARSSGQEETGLRGKVEKMEIERNKPAVQFEEQEEVAMLEEETDSLKKVGDARTEKHQGHA